MDVPKLNNHIEKRASKEIENIRNPWQKLKEDDEDLKEKIQQEELDNCNKNIVKSNN